MTQQSDPTKNTQLYQSVSNLLSPDFSRLQEKITALQNALDEVTSLSNPLPKNIQKISKQIQSLQGEIAHAQLELQSLQTSLADPDKITEIMKLGIHPALKQGIKSDPIGYGDVIAPVISPAIRNQIRDSRDEMVEALSPIIGQTIAKAIAEAFQDFRRRLDAQLKQGFNFRQRLQQAGARLKGVSEADLLIRSAFNYSITHVFLIHRQTGLLLKQLACKDDIQDMDLISGMLTAIRDFAKQTIGQDEHDLEDIQYGNSHILIKTGQYAYLAAVVEGIQPAGYTTLLESSIHEINVRHDKVLRQFIGNMDQLPDFSPELKKILEPDPRELEPFSTTSEIGDQKKVSVWPVLIGLVVLLGIIAFGCVYSIKLLPVAFPKQPTATAVMITPTPTNTQMPQATETPRPVYTPVPTLAVDQYFGVMTGNVWAHEGPDYSTERIPLVVATSTKVELLAVYQDWVKITWDTAFGVQEGWVPLKFVGVPYDIPEKIMTPAR